MTLYEFIESEEAKGLLIGVAMALFVLGVEYYSLKSVHDHQSARISHLTEEIERLRPPANKPGIDWQAIMTGLGEKQKIYWGRRLLLLAAHMPKEAWLTSLEFVSSSGQKAQRDPGLYITGQIYAPSEDVNLNKIGDYILMCLNDANLTAGMSSWRINDINRVSPSVVQFEIKNLGFEK